MFLTSIKKFWARQRAKGKVYKKDFGMKVLSKLKDKTEQLLWDSEIKKMTQKYKKWIKKVKFKIQYAIVFDF